MEKKRRSGTNNNNRRLINSHFKWIASGRRGKYVVLCVVRCDFGGKRRSRDEETRQRDGTRDSEIN
jgi:hypothetical protein